MDQNVDPNGSALQLLPTKESEDQDAKIVSLGKVLKAPQIYSRNGETSRDLQFISSYEHNSKRNLDPDSEVAQKEFQILEDE